MPRLSHTHSHSHTCLVSAALLLSICPGIAAAAVERQPDFNGDGFADLVMPVYGEKIGPNKQAGAVNVIYGSGDKLKAADNQFWNQNSAGIADNAEENDYFGSPVAWGDFNADGYSDLVASASGENNGAGAVHVIYGSIDGLVSAGNQIWRQGADGIAGDPQADEDFGYALAVGDFNGDTYDDLAISAPDQAVGGDDGAGVVHVIYGSIDGLSAAGSQLWSQDSSGLDAAAAEFLDNFGLTLAAGDFDGDGHDDLAIGVPFENFAVLNCGAVNVLYGSPDGLIAAGNQFLGQDSAGLADSAEEDDYFGWSLAAGDFDGDGRDDLAIGSNGEKVGTSPNAGCVHVLYGSNSGLRNQGSQFWTQDSNGIADSAEAGDWLGTMLAAGDFNNDGHDDLAIGSIGESIGALGQAGAVNIIYGSAAKLAKEGNQLFTQDSNGVAGAAAANDGFASLLMAADFNGDGRDDLAIGVPFENVGGQSNAGAMNVLYSGNNGLKGPGGQLWSQDSTGIADACEKNDYAGFGSF